MGTTFQSFHARHNDPKKVWAAIEEAGGCPVLLSRAVEDGWCSFYPKAVRKPRKLAAEVSEALGGLVLLFDVYDSDSCEIGLYNAGKLATRFVNEYEDRQGEPGDAKRFAKYARNHDEADIRSVLDRETVFAEEIAAGLAGYYGLSRERVVRGFAWVKSPDEVGLVLAPG